MKREPAIVLGMLFVLVLGGWAYPFLIPGYIGYDGDSLFLFYPAMDLAREELLAGRVPLWNPFKFLGSPMLADLMVPVFYPPQFLGLLPPQPFGLHLTLVFHGLLAAGGAWMAARRGFGTSTSGALIAGITYAFCAPMQLHASHPNQMYAMAWLPWVLLLAMETVRRERYGVPAILLGVALGLQGLAGQPQIVIYSGVIVALVILNGLATAPRNFIGRVPALAFAALITLGLSAIHLVPAFELSRYSLREGGSLEFAQSFSLPLANLKTLMIPGAMGGPGLGGYQGNWNFTETAVFAGQVLWPLAFVGLVREWRRSRTWIVLCPMLIVGSFWALGDSTPVYAIMLKLLPLLAQFRAPSRAFILVVLAACMLAAIGLDGVRAWVAERGEPVRGQRIAMAGAAVLIALQTASLMDFRFRVFQPRVTRMEDAVVPGWEQRLAGLTGGEGRVFRLMDEYDYGDESLDATRAKFERMQPDLNQLHRISVLGGYEEGMLPKRDYVFFMRENLRRIYSPRPDTRLLALMGIRYVLADKPVGGPGLRIVDAREGVALVENLDYRGVVFSRGDWPDLDWDVLGRNEVRFDPGTGAEIVGNDGEPDGGMVRAKRVAPGRITVEFEGVTDHRLIFSETWMPGWTLVLDDGQSLPGTRRAPFLIEFDLPEERGSGEIVYRPRSFRIGATVSLLTLLSIAVALAALARRREAAPA